MLLLVVVVIMVTTRYSGKKCSWVVNKECLRDVIYIQFVQVMICFI